jgi:hypothetical protein
MKQRKLLFTLAILVIAFGAQARQRTVDQARVMAQTFLSDRATLRSAPGVQQGALSLVYTATGAPAGVTQEPLYYVFNQGANGGFVIVASDDRAKEVLGYADAGTFDATNLPDNFKYWLSVYENELEELLQTPDTGPAATPQTNATLRSVAYETSVAPLIKTKWNQDSPYNLLTPNNYPTGCVATAMAQIMNYHEWPTQGTGSHEYTTSTIGTPLSADFGATTYDWGNMLNTYGSSAMEDEENAVATLMYHCGVSVNMLYAPNESGAFSQDVPNALKTYFGYDPGIELLYRDYTTSADWVATLKTELTNDRPVYYAGNGTGGGHAFVCDGYDANGKFHFNWGWSGSADGYYELSALNPSDLGIGGGSGGYNYGQNIVVGIQQPTTPPGSSDGFNISYETVASSATTLSSLSETFTVTVAELWNLGTASFSGNIGLAIYDDTDELKSYQNRFSATLDPYQGWYERPFSDISLPSGLPLGTYRLYPAYSVEPNINDPIKADAKIGGGVPYLTITVSGSSVTIGEFSNAPILELEGSLVLPANLYVDKMAEIKATVTNTGATLMPILNYSLQALMCLFFRPNQ